jgi:hypothetical protein
MARCHLAVSTIKLTHEPIRTEEFGLETLLNLKKKIVESIWKKYKRQFKKLT